MKPSEDDLTLILLGSPGKYLAEYLSKQDIISYTREMNGYVVEFKESNLNESDFFKSSLSRCLNNYGFANILLAIDYY
ncbi:hypothetical protein D3C81_2094320 [compost metagenome]